MCVLSFSWISHEGFVRSFFNAQNKVVGHFESRHTEQEFTLIYW
jgi:hypothetical protein